MSEPDDGLDDDPATIGAGESFQDSGASQPNHSKTYLAFRFLAENLMLIAAGVGIVAFLVLAIIGYELPRNVKIISLSALITIPLAGRPTAKKTKDWLWNPNLIWLVDIDVTDETDGGIYNIPSQRFREWSVTEGSLDWESPTLAFGKNVDLE